MGRKELRDFTINIVALQNATHDFDFKITQEFFQSFQNSLVEKGEGEAFLKLDNSETMLHLHFNIQCQLELTCDVTLEKFFHPISVRKDIIVKFGEEDMELSEDVVVIHRDSAALNVSKFIYEFICLEIPMKKVHPRLKDVERDEIVYSDKQETEDSQEEVIDPRWEALKKLKN